MDFSSRETRIIEIDDVSSLDALAERSRLARLRTDLSPRNWLQKLIAPRPSNTEDRSPRRESLSPDGPYRQGGCKRRVELFVLKAARLTSWGATATEQNALLAGWGMRGASLRELIAYAMKWDFEVHGGLLALLGIGSMYRSRGDGHTYVSTPALVVDCAQRAVLLQETWHYWEHSEFLVTRL